jgi:hypothetical protein
LSGEKQQSVDGDAGLRTSGQGDNGFGEGVGKDVGEQSARNVVPVKCPGVLCSDRIGEDRTVAEHLQLGPKTDDDEKN